MGSFIFCALLLQTAVLAVMFYIFTTWSHSPRASPKPWGDGFQWLMGGLTVLSLCITGWSLIVLFI